MLTYDSTAPISFLFDGTEDGLPNHLFTNARMEMQLSLGPASILGGFTTAPVSGFFRILDNNTQPASEILLGTAIAGSFVRISETNALLFSGPSFSYLPGLALTAITGPLAFADPTEAVFTLTSIVAVGGGFFINPDGTFRTFDANASFSGNTQTIPTPGTVALCGLGSLVLSRRRRNPAAPTGRTRSGKMLSVSKTRSRSGRHWTMCMSAIGTALIGIQAEARGDLLGSAQSFAVLGGSTVTNTGPTLVTGDLGVWPGTAITGFPPGVVNGTIHASDAVAHQAQNDVTIAYNALAGMAPNQALTGTDLGGLTLTPGVYFFASSAFLTGTLTLDAMGDPNAMFVFQMGSTLITASNSAVATINGADGCNIYWQVGSSATLGTGTSFEGNILALTSITLTTGANILDGRALARNGAVTMDSNAITADCIPGPGGCLVLGSALIGLCASKRRSVR